MNGMSHSVEFTAYLKGDIRVDGWKSSWRHDFERRSAEDLAGRKFVSAPKARPKRTPQAPRFCAACPARLNHGNKCGYCQLHTPKVSKLKLAA